MIYGSRKFKNGSIHGYLEFSTGKKIVLTNKEKDEFDRKIRYWEYLGKET